MNSLVCPAPSAELVALGELIAQTAACLDAATHTLLTQIRRFDAEGGWHRQGALSCAHWLNWRVGLDLGAAREKVRVARALAGLPVIDAALARGVVSYSKVRAMTRVATPTNESELLEMARSSTAAQLERICRLMAQVQDGSGEQARAAEDRRWVRHHNTDDGMVSIQIRLRSDEATMVLEAIRVSAEGSAAGNLADAVVAMADATLRGEATQRTPVDVTFHVDASTFTGHTADGTGLSAETARRLCCDAGIAPLLESPDGAPLSVGRKTRTIPAPLRRALAARDQGCRFPGCTNQRVDGHHIVHWADGGDTSIDNLTLLCRFHHRCLHELGYRIERDQDGELTFRDPGGNVIPPSGGAPPAGYDARIRLAALAAAHGWIQASTTDTIPRWDGTTPDYRAAIDVLVAADARQPLDPGWV